MPLALRDVAGVGVGLAAMALAVMALPAAFPPHALPSMTGLALSVAAGGLAYAAVALAVDLAGARTLALRILRRSKAANGEG